MAPWITSGDTYTCSMSVEVRADSRLSSSSTEAELSVELDSCLKLLENRLAILSEPVKISTTGDGDGFMLPENRCTSEQKLQLGLWSNASANFELLM